jgi:para-nitrobenzyl esterase
VSAASRYGTCASAALLATNVATALSAAPIRLETGLVEGVAGRDPTVTVYRGLPYAAPPVGPLRFRPPEAALPWQGTKRANRFGDKCPQLGPTDGMSEDCLFANVWTAAKTGEARPVFVWIYGGGFAGGSGSDPQFDGEALARKGVIVVTFNYRSGPLGFLATRGLSQESIHGVSGNYGLMDDISLLKWVRRNIGAFGGDPTRVTIGGQSAGAGSVGFLAMSPLARGLFRGAIAESHSRYAGDPELRYLSVSYRTLTAAEAEGSAFADKLGATTPAALRALPWQKLIAPAGAIEASVETLSDGKPPLFRPVVDSYVLPAGYDVTYRAHRQNDVAVLTGNNRDETGAVPEDTFAQRRAAGAEAIIPGMPRTNLTVADFVTAANRKFGPLAAQYLKLYPAPDDDAAALQNNESARDNSRVSTFLWGRDWKPGTTKPVFTYFWTHRPTGDPAGARHGSEVLFAFNNLDARKQKWTGEDRRIADLMSSYWVNFIARGDPNGADLPRWPEYRPSSPTVMELGDHFAPISVADGSKLAFWTRFLTTQPLW